MFANPLGLLALLAVPAVLVLHLYRRRHAPRTVSALFLWEGTRQDPSAGPTRDRLERTASLVLECAAAALLALALAGPRSCERGGEHLVIVLDSTASMGASAGGQRAADRALDLIGERLDGLRGRDRVTVLRQDGAVLVGPQALVAEARAALKEWRPDGAGGDVQDALNLASALAGGGAVWVITDAPLPEGLSWPASARRTAVGVAADNIAIVDAGREADPAGLFVTVASSSATPWTGALALRLGDQVLSRTPLSLAPEARSDVRLSLPADAGPVELRLVTAAGDPWKDALEADDRVILAPPAAREVVLGSTLPPEMNHALGLDAGPDDSTGVARWSAAVPQSRAEVAQNANLILSREPLSRPGAWVVLLTGPADRGTANPEPALAGPLLRTQHPLLAGVTGAGLLWTPARRLSLGEQDTPVMLAGDRPLIVQHAGDSPRFTLDLDPYRSTLARSADWPVLLLNLAELRRAALPGLLASNLRAGEALRWTGDGEIRLKVSGDGEGELRGAGAIEASLGGLGLFTLTPEQGPPVAVAVNLLSAEESDLRGRGAEDRLTDAALSGASQAGGGAEVLLALLALGLIVADHGVLARRRA